MAEPFGLSYIGRASTGAPTGDPYTFTSVPLGDGVSGADVRYTVVSVAWTQSTGGALQSLTVGGVSATLISQNVSTTGGFARSALYIVDSSAMGTTANVVFDNTSAVASYIGIGIYRLVNPDSPTPYDFESDPTHASGVIDLSLDIPAGGAAVAVVSVHNNSALNVTWTGLSEVFDVDMSGLDDHHSDALGGSAGSPVTVTAACSDTTPQGMAGTSASWAPAAGGGGGVEALATAGDIETDGSVGIATATANVAAFATAGQIQIAGQQGFVFASDAISAFATAGAIELTGETGVAAATANVSALATSGAIEIAGEQGIAQATANVVALATAGALEVAGQQGVAAATANVEAFATSGSIEVAGQQGLAAATANVTAYATAGSVSVQGYQGLAEGIAGQSAIATAGAISVAGEQGLAAATANVVVLADAGRVALGGYQGVAQGDPTTARFGSAGGVGTTYHYKTLSQLEREKRKEVAAARKKVKREVVRAVEAGLLDSAQILEFTKQTVVETLPQQWVAPAVVKSLATRIFDEVEQSIRRRRQEDEDEIEAILLLVA